MGKVERVFRFFLILGLAIVMVIVGLVVWGMIR